MLGWVFLGAGGKGAVSLEAESRARGQQQQQHARPRVEDRGVAQRTLGTQTQRVSAGWRSGSVLQAEMQQVRSQRRLNEGYSVAPPGSAGTALTSSPARTLWAGSSPDSKIINSSSN